MQNDIIRRLSLITQEFYAKVAEDFSGTRKEPWGGWGRIIANLEGVSALRLLDIGCGNMRFERFLEANSDDLGIDSIDALMIDSCRFPDSPFPGEYLEADIVEGLLEYDGDTCRLESRGRAGYDLAVAFGVFHHIPSCGLRERLMSEMIRLTRKGGIIAISLWKLLDDERIARKASSDTARGASVLGLQGLDGDDLLIGWKDEKDVFRYCRNFSSEEIEHLSLFAERSGCMLIDSFSPESGNDRLNHYLVFRKD